MRFEAGQILQVRAQRSILIVDDEPVIRDLCARALKDYRTLQASGGKEALDILQNEQVDIVLTDVMMPSMNGIDLLKRIKEEEPGQPVVVMTGYADKETILLALKADADDFISKPINLLQLKNSIAQVLEKKALREELIQLKRMDRLKSDFLGLISHKLKTPATAISLFIQHLSRGIDDPDDPSLRQTLAMILDESDHLNRLIQDLLNYSDVILQEAPPEPTLFDPRDLALSVLSETRNAHGGRALEVETALDEPLPAVELARCRIRFALRAILDNAFKFTPEGGRVSLGATLEEDGLHLIVRDTGMGIPRCEMPKVFEKFYQVDPEKTGQVRGFGLGLFYARKFVRSHRGNIRLESEPGLGTEARIILPLSA